MSAEFTRLGSNLDRNCAWLYLHSCVCFPFNNAQRSATERLGNLDTEIWCCCLELAKEEHPGPILGGFAEEQSAGHASMHAATYHQVRACPQEQMWKIQLFPVSCTVRFTNIYCILYYKDETESKGITPYHKYSVKVNVIVHKKVYELLPPFLFIRCLPKRFMKKEQR
jgi:hypothetical protein